MQGDVLSCTEFSSASSSSVSNSEARKLTASLAVREASFEDYSQIAALEAKYGLEVKSYEEWNHLWVNNPAYQQNRKSLPIGWVLEREKQKILAYLGNIPLFYELDGKRLLASVAHAWVAENPYRSYSLLLLERYFSQTVVDLFLNATVGPLASESFAVFQSLPTPVGAWDQSVFWITNYPSFLGNWLRMKRSPLAKPLSYVLAPGLFVKDTLAKPQRCQKDTVKIDHCTEVDERFDVFWAALRKIKSRLLMGVRSREALEWHYKYALQKNQAWIATVDRGSDLAAYAIFRRHDSPRFGLRRIRLVDFQTLDGDARLLIPILFWALKRCRIEGIDMLECIGFGSDKKEVIDTIAPHTRKLPSWLYYYKARDTNLAKKLSEPTVWDPSQFDGDASL